MKYSILLVAPVLLIALFAQDRSTVATPTQPERPTPADNAVATFAGGCFWCVEADFEKEAGVTEAISGYAGGEERNPTYPQVSSGSTGHVEAVQVMFDPRQISYAQILNVFWKHVDPTDDKGQFVDRGRQYRTAIFYHDESQRQIAEESRQALASAAIFDRPIVTEIRPLKEFYKAEEYHQDYYKNHPIRYRFYRYNSGRDQFLEKVWKDKEGFQVIETSSKTETEAEYKKPDQATLRSRLTQLQYRVTQKDATEPPFRNEYWNNKAEGIYVDVVSGEPLFRSTDKFVSGTGWPSFTKSLNPEGIVEKQDWSLFLALRTEVRSKLADSHLGHLFTDGPHPTGLRYCINSAALRFIPKDRLQEEGYKDYVSLFNERQS